MHCKAQNKQVDQPYIKFFFFFTEIIFNKKIRSRVSRVGLGSPAKKKKSRVTCQPFFTSGKKNQVQVGYFPLSLGRVGENLNLFFHV